LTTPWKGEISGVKKKGECAASSQKREPKQKEKAKNDKREKGGAPPRGTVVRQFVCERR